MGFSIGPWEVLLILVVVVIVVGPQRLPEVARSIGNAFRTIKKAGADLSAGINRELEETKAQKPPPPPTGSSTPADKPSPAGKPDSPRQDDQSRKTGGASAKK